jgi:hypothetical protein
MSEEVLEQVAQRPATTRQLTGRLGEIVVEEMLERADARSPWRSLEGPTPAVAIHLDVSCTDFNRLPGDGEEAVRWLASQAVHRFIDSGFCATVLPNDTVLFIHTTPVIDATADDATRFVQCLDDELVRTRITEVAADFVEAANRRLVNWGLTVEVRMREGTIDYIAPTLATLVPARVWVPLDLEDTIAA